MASCVTMYTLGLLGIYVYGAMASTTGAAGPVTTNAAPTTAAPAPAPAPNGGANPPPGTTTTEKTFEAFFDDPHNQATYIVLPVMVFVYGGCAMIYCIAKCRRNCKKRAKKRQRELLIKQGVIPDPEQNCFDNVSYKENNVRNEETFVEKYEPDTQAAKPMLQRGSQKMGYNIMPLPNSTEDPVISSNIDTHLKNAFAMIENAARDIKMQQALGLKSCPDRYPADGENETPIPKRTGFRKKAFIAV